MKLILSSVVLALASVSAVAGAQQTDTNAPKKPATQAQSPENAIKVSPKALKAIGELQTAVNAKDTANIPAKVAAAKAVATTNEDRYWIARLELKASVDANDNAGLAAAVDSLAATGLASHTDLGSLYSAVGGNAFDAKQYDAAAKAFEREVALDPSNATALVNLAVARSAGGHKPEALSALQQAIQASNAAGKKADEKVYRQAVGIAYEANLPSAVALSQNWVTAYPSPESWRNAIAIYRNQTHQDGEGTLDLLRLMQATGAMQKPTDYALFVNADFDQQNYSEAQAVIDAGVAAHIVDPASADFHQLVAELKSKPKTTPADLNAALKMSPSGINLLHIGDRFYATGDYAKAAEIYRQTMGKTGVDPDLSNLHLGMALIRSGDKAGAIAAFKAVTGARADIAKLWLIYAQQ